MMTKLGATSSGGATRSIGVFGAHFPYVLGPEVDGFSGVLTAWLIDKYPALGAAGQRPAPRLSDAQCDCPAR